MNDPFGDAAQLLRYELVYTGGGGPAVCFKSILSRVVVVVVSENEAGRKALQCTINGKLLFSFETCDEQNAGLKCFVALMPF